jgi:glycolate oxidase FAD binding subunit
MVKLAVPLSGLATALDLAQRCGSGRPLVMRGSLGAGVLYLGLQADVPPAEVVGWVEALRSGLSTVNGTAVVLSTSTLDGLDRWGPVAGAGLMRRIKDQFDPDRRLAPGRFGAVI